MAKKPNDVPPSEEKNPMFDVEPIKPVEPRPAEVKTADLVKPKPARATDAEFALMSRMCRALATQPQAARKRIVAYLSSRYAEEGQPADE